MRNCKPAKWDILRKLEIRDLFVGIGEVFPPLSLLYTVSKLVFPPTLASILAQLCWSSSRYFFMEILYIAVVSVRRRGPGLFPENLFALFACGTLVKDLYLIQVRATRFISQRQTLCCATTQKHCNYLLMDSSRHVSLFNWPMD